MTETEFLEVLNSVEFPRRYWEFCDRFPVRPTGQANLGRKEDIISAFREMGIVPRRDSSGRCYTVEEERIGGIAWYAVFIKQRHGLELVMEAETENPCLGSNFAVLAYDARKLADPTFARDRFKGPPPYPRPEHNGDPATLKEIVKEFVILVRLVKSALRSAAATQA